MTMINAERVKAIQKNSLSFKFKIFLMLKLPVMGFLCGMRIRKLTEET